MKRTLALIEAYVPQFPDPPPPIALLFHHPCELFLAFSPFPLRGLAALFSFSPGGTVLPTSVALLLGSLALLGYTYTSRLRRAPRF